MRWGRSGGEKMDTASSRSLESGKLRFSGDMELVLGLGCTSARTSMPAVEISGIHRIPQVSTKHGTILLVRSWSFGWSLAHLFISSCCCAVFILPIIYRSF